MIFNIVSNSFALLTTLSNTNDISIPPLGIIKVGTESHGNPSRYCREIRFDHHNSNVARMAKILEYV